MKSPILHFKKTYCPVFFNLCVVENHWYSQLVGYYGIQYANQLRMAAEQLLAILDYYQFFYWFQLKTIGVFLNKKQNQLPIK